jgi:hypothetical protein
MFPPSDISGPHNLIPFLKTPSGWPSPGGRYLLQSQNIECDFYILKSFFFKRYCDESQRKNCLPKSLSKYSKQTKYGKGAAKKLLCLWLYIVKELSQ